jgi:hypothetical protein
VFFELGETPFTVALIAPAPWPAALGVRSTIDRSLPLSSHTDQPLPF